MGSNRFQEDFESLKMLEKGDNGEVYLVCHRITGVRYAIKKSTKTSRWRSVNCPYVYDYNQTVFGEARALSALEHKNIIQYFFCWVEDRHLYLQLEYCSGGSLEGLVRKKESITTEKLYRICRQMSSALDYLSNLGLVHCDVKPSNILITRGGGGGGGGGGKRGGILGEWRWFWWWFRRRRRGGGERGKGKRFIS